MNTALVRRFVLVVGSQCEALGENARLTFLPEAAEDLYAVMIDPDLGHCFPALAGGGLLLNPTVTDLKTAVKAAFCLASEEEATLLLAFVGHGCFVGNDYYFLPRDSRYDPDPDAGIHVVQQIEYAFHAHPNLDGLVLLIDSCHSGLAVEQAALRLVAEHRRGHEGGRKLRFELLTAASADRPAWDGCFTRTVTHCVRHGVDDVSTRELRCEDVSESYESDAPEAASAVPCVQA